MEEKIFMERKSMPSSGPAKTVYYYDRAWNHDDNQQAVTSLVQTFICPSTPGSGPSRLADATGTGGTTKMAVTDYVPVTHVADGIYSLGVLRPEDKPVSTLGVMGGVFNCLPQDIVDGVSKTLVFVEAAGRPSFYAGNLEGPPAHDPGNGNPAVAGGVAIGAGWADINNPVSLNGSSFDGIGPGPCPVNCTNNSEAYSFHPGGLNVAFADQSIQFLAEDISLGVYSALITRAGVRADRTYGEYELITPGDY
jgi:prepilin-type processing-associated H-X9-DG protein